jgi:hypothetical protein
VLYYIEYHQWLTLKQKKRITYVFVRKKFRFKTFQNEVKNLDCAVLRRTPSVVVVKAKIKPITYVFFRKKIRFKTLQNKVFILQSESLCCITSNTISC